MAAVPKRAAERIAAGLKQFQPILTAAKARDINESDTAILVTDMLQSIFGYDKFAEVTSEHMIRSTFCDLAIKLDGRLAVLIEIKAIGHELKDQYVKQAVDYAANQGCDWVALTNGITWRIYRVTFSKPIEAEVVVEFDLLALNHRAGADVELLALVSKEGWLKSHLDDYHTQRQALSRFTLAGLILSEAVLDVLRREVRRLAPEVRVDNAELGKALRDDVLKREVLEGEKADGARKRIARAAAKSLRNKAREASADAASAVDSKANAPAPEQSAAAASKS